MLCSGIALFLLFALEISPGLDHNFNGPLNILSYATFLNIDTNIKDILWAYATIGSYQIFNSILYGAVLLDAYATRASLTSPVLWWALFENVWIALVPYLMGRDLASVSSDAPVAALPWIEAGIAVFGIIDFI